MPKVKCLRKLANTLAGSEIVTDKDNTICRVLSKMATNLRVIPDDNELLHDVSDVVFNVNFTQTGDTYTADKTIDEIIEADTAGKVIVGHLGVFRVQPAQISTSLCYFYSEVMETTTISQRASVAYTPSGIGVTYIRHVLTPPDAA